MQGMQNNWQQKRSHGNSVILTENVLQHLLLQTVNARIVVLHIPFVCIIKTGRAVAVLFRIMTMQI
jgi:hypothetical protein